MPQQLVKAVTGREDKTMGVEIEFFGVTRQAVCDALTTAGVRAKVERYGHSVPRGFWKLVTDGSVTGTNTGDGTGIEIVSPPLNKAEMDRQLRIVCDVLVQVGAKQDKTCGVHVHHDVQDLGVEHLKNVFRLYAKHEYAIDTFFPESRRGSQWARRVSRLLPTIEGCTTIEQMKDRIADNQPRHFNRYHAINFCCYISYGTLEFRQHAASMNAEKILQWATISQQLIAAAVRKRKIAPMTAHMATRENLAFTRDIFLEGTEEAKYFEKRRAELKRDVTQAQSA